MVSMAQYEDDVKILKEWHSKQPHLPQDIDENLYYTFVSGTNSMEKSKSKLDAYLTMRNKVFNLYDISPTADGFREKFKKAGVVFLPGKTPEGCKVMFVPIHKFGDSSVDDIHISALIAVEALLAVEPTATSIINISDLQHAKANLLSFSLPKFKAYNDYFNKTLPLKNKKSILINTPGFVEKIMSFLTTVLSKKISDRISVLKNDMALHEILPAEMLPSDYGGKGAALEELADYWADVVESKKTWFEKQSRLTTDESLRPKDSYQWGTMDFGVEGTFKKLNID